MAEADSARLHGKADRAQSLLLEAAQTESQAFEAIPADRVRTRGVIAASAVVLFRRAGDLDEAIRRAHLYLADRSVLDTAGPELRSLLDDLELEKSLASRGQLLSSDSFEWILRGPAVAAGVAQVDVVVQKISQIEKAAIRSFEYLLNLPMRLKGPPAPEVQNAVQVLIGEPIAGSFGFSFRLSTSTEQLRLFEAKDDRSEKFAEFFSRVLAATATEEPEHLVELVPEDDYRLALARLVRNIGPDGRRLTEVDFVRLDVAGPERTSRFTKTTAKWLGRYIEGARPPATETQQVIDRLRGLNLNDQHIIVGDRESERTIKVSSEVPLEDIAGPLVNRRVRVKLAKRGRWLLAEDIEEWTDESSTEATQLEVT